MFSLLLLWIRALLFAFSGNGSRRSRAVSYSFEDEFTHNRD